MKTLTKSILIVLCITLLSSAQLLAQEWSAEQKEVWAEVEGLWQAWVEGDYNKIISFVAEDFRGWRDNFHAPYTVKDDEPWAKRWLQTNKIVLLHFHPYAIDIHDDVAIVFYSYQCVLEQKDGSDKDEQGKWTGIYQKIGGKWLLIAESGFDFSSSAN